MSKNRRYLDKMEYPHPHIGQLVWKVMCEKKISKAEAARLMNVSPSSIANYLCQPSLQFGILWKLCVVLKYDFLSDLQQYYPPNLPADNGVRLKTEEKIKDLEKEIAIYKAALKIG